MSDSTSLLTQLTTAQAGKEATVNELMNAASPALLFGRKQSSSGLNFDYFGGRFVVDGVSTSVANGTRLLTASVTSYIEATRAGAVSHNTVGFTAGSIALYKVVTDGSTVTSYEDHRPWVKLAPGRLSVAHGDVASLTLTHAQALNDILELTGALTAQRNVVLPLDAKQYTVFNNTTGGFGIQFIGATGTGVIVAATVRSIIYADGTNIVSVAGGGGGVTDHGLLTGLADDDHPQYALDTDLSAHVASADPHPLYALDTDLAELTSRGKVMAIVAGIVLP